MVFSQWVEDITPLQKGCKNDSGLFLNDFESRIKAAEVFYAYFADLNIMPAGFIVYH
ncbi:hypothetical protein SDC9_137278 [bioreactor metagenome]|uniref:Uncharacterized protein n=1 Tax=bioreactor metagenome TaxID=1076179 RepID=A0A645DLP3_9ZZZZ